MLRYPSKPFGQENMFCARRQWRQPFPSAARSLRPSATTEKIFQIGQEYRYAEFYRSFHKSILDGEIGNLRMLWCHEFVEFDNLFQGWHRLRENNGGLLVTKNCHHFDLSNWMTGVPPVRVFAMGGSIPSGPSAMKFSGDHCESSPSWSASAPLEANYVTENELPAQVIWKVQAQNILQRWIHHLGFVCTLSTS